MTGTVLAVKRSKPPPPSSAADDEIAYWRECAYSAETTKSAFLAFGVHVGLRIAKNEYLPRARRALAREGE